MMHDTITPITAEQLFAMPSDGNRYELIAGELKVMSPAGSIHGVIISRINSLLSTQAYQTGLGEVFGAETGFFISQSNDTVRVPDVSFVRAARIAETGIPATYYPGPPDLAVEVVSPSDRSDEVEAKVKLWLDSGCREVWVVSPILKTVTLYYSLMEIGIFAGEQVIDSSRVLPDFRGPLAEIFAGIN